MVPIARAPMAIRTSYGVACYINLINLSRTLHNSQAGRFGEARAMLYAAEIASALEHLHDKKVPCLYLDPEDAYLYYLLPSTTRRWPNYVAL